MAVRRGGGGGGGGSGSPGFQLGPAQNTFEAASLAAANNRRNAYAGANAAWLADYNEHRNFMVRSRVTGPPVVNHYYRRNVAGDDWEEVANVVVIPGNLDNAAIDARIRQMTASVDGAEIVFQLGGAEMARLSETDIAALFDQWGILYV